MPKKKLTLGWYGLAVCAAWLASSYAAEPSATTTAASTEINPYAHGNAQNGATKAAACFACHGANGNSTNPEWPTLAGQSAVYITEQLRLFRGHVRPNPVMMPMVSALSDADIDDIAVYFAAQTPIGAEADPSYWKAGETLYRRGDRARAIPACAACHGPVGRGNLGAGYPALRTQHAVYTMKQLKDYADGTRYSGASDPVHASRNGIFMTTIAKRLRPEDIRNVASYIQGLR